MDLMIDCGYNLGGYSRAWLDAHPGGRVYAFEPCPPEGMVLHNGVELLRKAAWVRGGEATLHMSSRLDGHSLMAGKKRATGVLRTVPCVDFARWVLDTVPEGAAAECKMDIEGAELEVVPRMLELGAFSRISSLLLELHGRQMKARAAEFDRLEALLDAAGVPWRRHK